MTRSGILRAGHRFTQKIRPSGPLPSFETVGDALDNAMMESFWSKMLIEPHARHQEDLDVPNATFDSPDLTTFARPGELGLMVVGQRLTPRRAVLVNIRFAGVH